MQNLPSDCFDNDGSDSEIDPVVNAALASAPAVEFDKSDSNDEADDQVTHSVVQGRPSLIQGRDGSKWRKITVSSAVQGGYLTISFNFSLDLHHIPQVVLILTSRFHCSGYYLMNQY